MQKFFDVKNGIAFLNLLADGVEQSEAYMRLTYYEFIHAIIFDEPNDLVREDLAAQIREQIKRVYKDRIKGLKPAELLAAITSQASQIAYSKLDMDMLTDRDFSDEVELFAIARGAIRLESTIMREFSYRDEDPMSEDDPRHPLSY